MVDFLVNRIIEGKLAYTLAVTKRPDLKDEIDALLTTKGHEELIV